MRPFFASISDLEAFEKLGAAARQRKAEGACPSAISTGRSDSCGQGLDRNGRTEVLKPIAPAARQEKRKAPWLASQMMTHQINAWITPSV